MKRVKWEFDSIIYIYIFVFVYTFGQTTGWLIITHGGVPVRAKHNYIRDLLKMTTARSVHRRCRRATKSH